jgi:hypothetical protein
VGGEFDKRLTALAENEITPALLTQGSENEGEEGTGRQQRGNGGGERGA